MQSQNLDIIIDRISKQKFLLSIGKPEIFAFVGNKRDSFVLLLVVL